MNRYRASKKEIERWHLGRFEESYPDFPSGEVQSGESPDFRVISPIRTVGIELTRVFHPTDDGQKPLQGIERQREFVTQKAEAFFEAAGGPPLDVMVYFSPHVPLTKVDSDRVASRLAELVNRKVPEPGQSYKVEFDWNNRDWFPEELSFVRVARFDHPSGSLWRPTNAGFVPDVTPDLIQTAINKKAPDIHTYRASCDDVWLLIIADGFSISSTMTLADTTRQHTYRSPFDKTVYFDNFRKMAYELTQR